MTTGEDRLSSSQRLTSIEKSRVLVLQSRKDRINSIYRGFLEKTLFQHTIKDVRLRFNGPAIDQDVLKIAANSGNRTPRSRFALWLKLAFLKAQFNWAHHYLRKLDPDFLIVWNGIKGHRRLLAHAAQSKSIPVVYFEESPLPERITVDFQGVNYGCSLPRQVEFYRKWAAESNIELRDWRRLKESLVPRKTDRKDVAQKTAQSGLDTENFIFCPLQVPGDSQLTIYGDWVQSIEDLIDTLAKASESLPEGWHFRIKEHPSARHSFAEKLDQISSDKLRVDNSTNTFEQVAASRAVLNVNSSVGLQAFFFDKPVITLGHSFYAFGNLAYKCSNISELKSLVSEPEELTFDQDGRDAFMSYLDKDYYPYEHDLVAGNFVLKDALERDIRRAAFVQ